MVPELSSSLRPPGISRTVDAAGVVGDLRTLTRRRLVGVGRYSCSPRARFTPVVLLMMPFVEPFSPPVLAYKMPPQGVASLIEIVKSAL